MEQVASTRQGGVNPRDDVYSLGATIYYLLTKRYLNSPMIPFMEKALGGGGLDNSVYALRDYSTLEAVGLDSKIVRFIKDMTSENRDKRPSSLEVFNFFTSLVN